jgi:hypothetical protein
VKSSGLASAFRTALFTWAPLLLLAACGSGGSAGQEAEQNQFITCDTGTVKMTGAISGSPVSITQSAAGGGFSQFQGGEYCTQCNRPDHDAALLDVQLRWMGLVSDGSTADATGEVVMPTSGPSAGEKFCAGPGTRIRMANQGEQATLQFAIRGLKGGSACTTEVMGELDGCYHH